MQIGDAIALSGVILAVVGSLIAVIMNGILGTLKDTNKAISDLNVKVGVVIERVDNHERRLGRLESD